MKYLAWYVNRYVNSLCIIAYDTYTIPYKYGNSGEPKNDMTYMVVLWCHHHLMLTRAKTSFMNFKLSD